MPTGEILASAGKDKTIKLWTVQGTLCCKPLKRHSGKVNCVTFSPDGQFIASASDDRTAKLWNLSGKLLKTFDNHQNWVLAVAFSPDSQRLATASADNTVKLWQRNGTLLKTFTGHSDSVTSVSFNPLGLKDWGLETGDGKELFQSLFLLQPVWTRQLDCGRSRTVSPNFAGASGCYSRCHVFTG
jgi:WD40 repeat protein